MVKIQQQLDFGHEVRLLKNKRPLDPKSKLQALNPFLDSDGVLRVGGRLQNAMIPYNVKHPNILDKSHLKGLIAKDAHKETAWRN